MIEIDRSRLVAYQSCPRQRYLAYHHLGAGLQRKAKALPLQFGSAFHEGCEVLLTGGGIESAVLRAQLFLSNAFAQGAIGFDGEQPPDAQKAIDYGKEEQSALAEGLLRAWWAYEGPSFLEQFEILEVEKEGRATLARPGNSKHEMDDLVLMFRPDALVRDRESNDLYVLSWKTCSTFSQRTVDQSRHDMQSMSEVWGIQNTPDPSGNNMPFTAHIEGVLYKWIVKGRRTLDKWDGLWKQNSPLIYGWKKSGPAIEGDDWAWCYEFPREDGQGDTRLGKGWKKVPVWKDYQGGVKQWINDLANRHIHPRHVDPLAAVFPQSLPVERRADEIAHWKQQVVAQETSIAHSIELLEGIHDHPDAEEVRLRKIQYLDVLFPQHTGSCHSYSGCPFIPICHEGIPAEVGELYQIRTTNHPEGMEDENGQ